MIRKGETWNESETYADPVTLRRVRRVTTAGLYNNTPTYHTNTGFTADGEFLVFATARQGRSGIMRCHVPTGDITMLTEPLDGVGSHGMYLKMAGLEYGNALGTDMHMAIAPRSGWVAYMGGLDLRAVNLYTLQERVLIPGVGPAHTWGVPSIDPSETSVIVAIGPTHPELFAGRRATRPYAAHYEAGGWDMQILQVPLEGGPVEVIYEEQGAVSNHTCHSPVDGDLLLIDRDPLYHRYTPEGVSNRIWTLRLSTGALTELAPQDERRLQVHSVWRWDGEAVYYHGPSAGGGWYIGVVSREGETIREYAFRAAGSYGHVSAMAGREAIILDGNLSTDLLQWLYYDGDTPRVEVIARHGTDWQTMFGQYPHPHPLSDPTGRYVSFNAAHKGRSDVFVVEV